MLIVREHFVWNGLSVLSTAEKIRIICLMYKHQNTCRASQWMNLRTSRVHPRVAQCWGVEGCTVVQLRPECAAIHASEQLLALPLRAKLSPSLYRFSKKLRIAKPSPKINAFSVFSHMSICSLTTALDFPSSPAQWSLHLPRSVEERQVMPAAREGWVGRVSDTHQMLPPPPSRLQRPWKYITE